MPHSVPTEQNIYNIHSDITFLIFCKFTRLKARRLVIRNSYIGRILTISEQKKPIRPYLVQQNMHRTLCREIHQYHSVYIWIPYARDSNITTSMISLQYQTMLDLYSYIQNNIEEHICNIQFNFILNETDTCLKIKRGISFYLLQPLYLIENGSQI